MSALATDASDPTWTLPSRGKVGMLSLIVAESAIFVIFVVAYLFYVGKSLSGPTPAVLHTPIFFSICLFASSWTIHRAVKALRSNRLLRALVARDHRARSRVPRGHGSGVAAPDRRRRPDHPDEPLRDHLLLAGRAARVPPRRGSSGPGDGRALLALRPRQAG